MDRISLGLGFFLAFGGSLGGWLWSTTGATVSTVPKEEEVANLSWFAWDLPEFSTETLQAQANQVGKSP